VPARLGYVAAARRLRELLAAGIPVGAVLAGSDEGVLIANRLGAGPVIDQVDVAQPPRRPAGRGGPAAWRPMTLLTDRSP